MGRSYYKIVCLLISIIAYACFVECGLYIPVTNTKENVSGYKS